MNKHQLGLYEKFKVERTDGESATGEKHEGCEYFVLDLTHDPFAMPALAAYAAACQQDYPRLAIDLFNKVGNVALDQYHAREQPAPTLCACGHDKLEHSGHLRNGRCQGLVDIRYTVVYCQCRAFVPVTESAP